MFRVIVPEGEIRCTRYEMTDSGVELYTEADEHIAFVPFSNLRMILNEDVHEPDEDELSIM